MNDILNTLIKNEDLLSSKNNSNWIEIVSELLSDDFIEIGSSGKIYNKQQTIDELNTAPGQAIIRKDFKLKQLSVDTFLLKYIAVKNQPDKNLKSYRSSIWKHSGGKWQILFHQGTNIK